MISIIENNKRALTVLGFLFFCLVCGLILMVRDIAFSGGLFLASALITVIYSPLVWILGRNGYIRSLESLTEKEVWIALIGACILCLSGAIEASPDHPVIVILFSVLFTVLIVLNYVHFRRKGLQRIDEDILFKIGFWLFVIAVGALLISLEDADIEPFFSFGTFFYFMFLIYWGVRWATGQVKSTLRLKKETSTAELGHLQSQVNPHFFFNMLNNLYALVDKDSEQAKAMILKLSEMMRYSIYESQNNLVPVEHEVEFLENYINLHKMRYHQSLDIEFNADIQEERLQVIPLLFIILLENAFKHGIEKLREHAYIRINMTANAEQLDFSIENNFEPGSISTPNSIGLKNLIRRLELAYPKSHTFELSDADGVYKAHLSLRFS